MGRRRRYPRHGLRQGRVSTTRAKLEQLYGGMKLETILSAIRVVLDTPEADRSRRSASVEGKLNRALYLMQNKQLRELADQIREIQANESREGAEGQDPGRRR